LRAARLKKPEGLLACMKRLARDSMICVYEGREEARREEGNREEKKNAPARNELASSISKRSSKMSDG
jgi:hypothetical protein